MKRAAHFLPLSMLGDRQIALQEEISDHGEEPDLPSVKSMNIQGALPVLPRVIPAIDLLRMLGKARPRVPREEEKLLV